MYVIFKWPNLVLFSLIFVIQSTRQKCGLHFTAADEGSCDDIDGIDETTSYTLMGIYTGCGVIAFLMVALFVDPLEVSEMEEKTPFFRTGQTSVQNLTLNDFSVRQSSYYLKA